MGCGGKGRGEARRPSSDETKDKQAAVSVCPGPQGRWEEGEGSWEQEKQRGSSTPLGQMTGKD